MELSGVDDRGFMSELLKEERQLPVPATHVGDGSRLRESFVNEIRECFEAFTVIYSQSITLPLLGRSIRHEA
jgi:hypothetical protein